ncbi:MAG: septal ring lytic transglycosylase RlpA family protein [Cytophagia bacterium]|jgi:rare lipoprotein A|nr:septal ring lytic transglycosylase RlpA family protein [Cytophagia bacterium]
MSLVLVFGLLLGYPEQRNDTALVQVGTASVYAKRFDGRRTSSGQIHRSNALSAAHKSLPPGTRVKVTHLRNGCSVEIVVNDRLPRQSPHIIDLSPKAAAQIEIPTKGIGRVRVEEIRP